MCRLPLIFPSSSLKAYCKEGCCTEEEEEGTQLEMMNCQTLLKKKKKMDEKVWSLQAKKVLPAWLYLQKWLWTADTTLVAAPQVLAQYQGWIWLQLPPRPINLSQRQIQCDCLFWQNGCKLNPPPPITDCERCFLIRTVNQISKNPLTVSTEGRHVSYGENGATWRNLIRALLVPHQTVYVCVSWHIIPVNHYIS